MEIICDKCDSFCKIVFKTSNECSLICSCGNFFGGSCHSRKYDTPDLSDEYIDSEFEEIKEKYWQDMKQMLEDGWNCCEMLAEYTVMEANK